MAPADLEATLRADEVAPGYLNPRYRDYSFANVPGTAARALGVDLGRSVPAEPIADYHGVERVLLLVVDGFGWAQWQRDVVDLEFLSRVAARGDVIPLTSIYPSETAACMTTFHTAQPPAVHGLVGWDVYVEALETVIEPLPFLTAAGEPLDRVAKASPDTELLFAGDPVYPAFRAAGVHPAVIQPAETVGTPYSERVLDGTTVAGYTSTRRLSSIIRTHLETGTTPQYLHVYYSAVDTAAHRAGTESAAHREALTALDGALDRLVRELDPAVAAETLLLVTADHGEVDTEPATNVDLYAIDGVRERLRLTSQGTTVPPVGGPRNVHCHVRPGLTGELSAILDRELDALVLDRSEYLDLELFGDAEPSALFDRRAGDLLVIPNARSVWHGDDPKALEFVGMHGGLHPDEALVPLAVGRLGDLVG